MGVQPEMALPLVLYFTQIPPLTRPALGQNTPAEQSTIRLVCHRDCPGRTQSPGMFYLHIPAERASRFLSPALVLLLRSEEPHV